MIELIFDFFIKFLGFFSILVVIYFVVINSVYLVLIGISFFHIRRQLKEKNVYRLEGLFSSNLYSPISIIAPAFNEEATITASVKSLLQLRYPNYEIIVVNDGSKDRTMQVLIQQFKLKRVKRYVPLILDHKPIKAIYRSTVYPELVVVDKENGRKADALNAGINVCRNDLFCAIDADCVLEPEVLQNMLKTFIEDDTTIAVGGIVRVANDCVIEGNEIKQVNFPKRFLPRIQVVEYLRAFLFGRVGWDYLDSLLIISGAFGIFDRNAVLKVGDYLHDTVGEDMELVVRLHKFHRENKIPYRVRFLPEPVCWTEVPEDYKVLSRQRNRWQRGLADTLFRHREMIFNPKYGRLGIFAVPFFFVFELLAPVIELLGWLVFVVSLLFGLVNWPFALVFLAAAVLFGMILSIASILCEEFTYRRYPKITDILWMVVFAFIENFGFRQVHMWWRLKGIVDFLKGNKSWGEMTRKGLGNQSALQNMGTQNEPTSDSVLNETIGDNQVDAKSYIDSLETRYVNPEADKPVQGEPKNVSILTKLVLTLIIIGVLMVSFWSKIDMLNSFGITGSGSTSDPIVQKPSVTSVPDTPDPTDSAVTVSAPDSIDFSAQIEAAWNDSSFYMIALNTYFSVRGGIFAGNFLMSTDFNTNPEAGLRDGNRWATGIGRYRTFSNANDAAVSLGFATGSYEIVRRNELTPVEFFTLIRGPQYNTGFSVRVDSTMLNVSIEALSSLIQLSQFSISENGDVVLIRYFNTKEEAFLFGWYFRQAGLITEFEVVFAVS